MLFKFLKYFYLIFAAASFVWSFMNQEDFDMFDQLYNLVDIGKIAPEEVRFVLDVGAFEAEFSDRLRKDGRFPNAQYLCIEANNAFETTYKEKKLNYVIAVVGELDDEEVNYFRVDPNKSNIETGNSIFKEDSIYFDNARMEKRYAYTIDSILDYLGLNSTAFHILKLDIQGSELKALRGAKRLLERSQDIVVITELSLVPYNGEKAPSFFDVVFEMTSQGFVMVDIFGYSSGKVETVYGRIGRIPIQFDAAWMKREKVTWRGNHWPLKDYPALSLLTNYQNE